MAKRKRVVLDDPDTISVLVRALSTYINELYDDHHYLTDEEMGDEVRALILAAQKLHMSKKKYAESLPGACPGNGFRLASHEEFGIDFHKEWTKAGK